MSAGRARRANALAREADAAAHIPYAALIEEGIVSTRAGDFVQVFELAGLPFESATDAEVNAAHERLNLLWRNLASPHLSIWTHLLRRRVQGEGDPATTDEAGTFTAELRRAHAARLKGKDAVGIGLFENRGWLSLVYRPVPQAAGGLALRVARRQREDFEVLQADALSACRRVRTEVLAGLSDYGIRPLSSPPALAGRQARSHLLGALGLLVNGFEEPRWPSRAPINEVLATSRLSFGTELMEYRSLGARRLAGVLGIKEYPAATTPGLLNALLTAPFELILTQSFTFLSKPAAQGLLQRQAHRLTNAGDFALSQREALRVALDQLTSNEFVMGDHHFSLQVLTDRISQDTPHGVAAATRRLAKDLASARSMLADAWILSVREDLGLAAAFWAQLPGNFSYRPRKAVITSRNFAAFAPFYGFPQGRAAGNHWGESVAVLKTPASSAFHFNLHVEDIGHTFVCGPTGSGKTAFVAFLIAHLTRFGATQIVLDKDRGLELGVRALGGAYLTLKSGEPTGLNPLALPESPENVEFLKIWLLLLVQRPGRPLSVTEEVDLEQALRATLELPQPQRRLSRVIEYLDASVPDGVYARLAPWCALTHGERAYCFDQPQPAAGQAAPGCSSEEGSTEVVADVLLPLLSRAAVIGVDVTEFLNSAEVREPVTLYLFHLIRQLLDGRRLICWIDEFWRVLGDPAFAQFAKDGPKTWRKLNAVMALATQSPSDVLSSPLSRTVVEQCATQIFFPNGQAQWSDYGEGFGLNEREFRLVREELSPASRRFLVRQGGRSGVCELDLSGLDEVLAVLSGRAANVALAETVRARVGEDPAVWLPAFQSARRKANGLTEGKTKDESESEQGGST